MSETGWVHWDRITDRIYTGKLHRSDDGATTWCGRTIPEVHEATVDEPFYVRVHWGNWPKIRTCRQCIR